MANDVVLPGSGAIVETLDTFAVSGVHEQRQVVTLSPRDLSGGDSIGGLTESAPISDTASAGLNGRLQRIAQRITALITALGSPMQASGGTVGISGNLPAFAATPTVNVGTAPLPTGAATSALQGTGNTSVASIDTKTPALGQALAASSVPVVLTTAQQTALTPPAAITGFALDTSLTTIHNDLATTLHSDLIAPTPAGTNNIGSVTGNVASGAADSGNPLKVGGKYNATLPTLTDGQRGDLQVGTRGSLNVTLMGKDLANGVVISAAADAQNFTDARLFTHSSHALYNGTTFDRQRSDLINTGVAMTNSPDAGTLAAGTSPITTAAVTVAITTGVVSWTNHNFTTGQPVIFPSTFGNITGGTTYYVCSGATLLTSSFTLSTSVANAVAGTGIATTASYSGNASAQGSNLTATGTLFSLDTSGYNAVSVQITSAGVGCVVTYESSNDNLTWVNAFGNGTAILGGFVAVSTTASPLVFALSARYFRARVSTYANSTPVTAYYTLRRTNTQTLVQLAGSNGSYLGNGFGNLDGLGTATLGLQTQSYNNIFNGTNWDRARSDGINIGAALTNSPDAAVGATTSNAIGIGYQGTAFAVTGVTIGANGSFATAAAHNLQTGQSVQFTVLGSLTGVSLATPYYVNVVDTTHFNVATSVANLELATYVTTTGTYTAGLIATVSGGFNRAAAATLFSIDTSGYNGIATQITSAGSATVSYEGSNDNTNWVALVGNGLGGSGQTTQSNTVIGHAVALMYRYYRARISSYTSGTVTAYYAMRRVPPNIAMQQVLGTASVGGTVASGSADSGNPVKVGGVFNTEPPTAITTGQRGDLQLTSTGELKVVLTTGTGFKLNTVPANGDGNSQGVNLLQAGAYGLVYNGATWDRLRGIGGAVSTAAKSLLWNTGTSNNGLAATLLTLQSTELNSLANAAVVLSSVGGSSGKFTNANTGAAIYGEVQLVLGAVGSALSVGANIAGWFIKSVDGGSTFEKSSVAPPRAPDFVVPLPATTITAADQFFASGQVKIPAVQFKVLLQNNTGQVLAASANTVALAPVAMLD